MYRKKLDETVFIPEENKEKEEKNRGRGRVSLRNPNEIEKQRIF